MAAFVIEGDFSSADMSDLFYDDGRAASIMAAETKSMNGFSVLDGVHRLDGVRNESMGRLRNATRRFGEFDGRSFLTDMCSLDLP